MKRDRFTIADIAGLDSEDQLAEYNKWLLHPKRPFGESINKFRGEFEEELKKEKRKKTKKVKNERED